MKSSFCRFGDCVEIEHTPAQTVHVRHGLGGPVLVFTQEEFEAFLWGVHAGEFGGPEVQKRPQIEWRNGQTWRRTMYQTATEWTPDPDGPA